MKRWQKIVLGAFVAFYVVSNPHGAAGTVNTIFDLLGEWANALATFVGALGG